jgi:hypothetical protein
MNRPMKGSGREEVLGRCRGILEAHTGNMVVSELDTVGIYCLLALASSMWHDWYTAGIFRT